MIKVRKSEERGHANHGWLNSYHTFSFGEYHDPHFMGFHDLLVINEDRVQPGEGFGRHGHADMEIISYVIEGELAHKDSLGTGSVIRPGDVQRMSAGTGVQHSEFNNSNEKPVHFLQIWILPKEKGIKPSYEEKKFSSEEKRNRLRLIVSPTGEQGSVSINQDVKIYATILEIGQGVQQEYHSHRFGWVQVVYGSIEMNGILLNAGDGAAISDEKIVELTSKERAEFILFDMP